MSHGTANQLRPLGTFPFGLSMATTLLVAVGCSTAGRIDAPGPHRDSGLEVRGQNEGKGIANFLDPRNVTQKVKVATGFGPNRAIAEEAFREAETRFIEATRLEGKERRGKFDEAAKYYQKAADRWPDSSLEEDALFMLAESNFFADRYPDAAKAYEILVKKLPNTRHMDTIDRRRFALAKYWVDHHVANPDLPITPNFIARERPLFDKFGHAVRVFDKIRFDDPTGKLADDATMAAGLANFQEGKYQQADDLLTDLRQSFPDSEHQFQAHLLGLQCKLKIYQGPEYSLTPMDQAEELIKQMFRQFPQESEQHREFLTKAWEQVRLNKADHDFSMARYYHRRKEMMAARQYYERVRDNFSDTSLGKEATKILAEIADAPPKPDQPLPWLANMFPTPERDKPVLARNPLDQLQRR